MRKVFRVYSRVTKVSGVYVEAFNVEGAVGDRVIIKTVDGEREGEIIGLHEDRCIIMPFGSMMGVKVGDKVLITGEKVHTFTGDRVIGAVLDPFGRSLTDGRVVGEEKIRVDFVDVNPLERERIREVLDCGVRSVNALLTLGKGQKVGVFAGAGVGKSTLLGMITRWAQVDVVVLALIGERGREVREFLEDVLGEEGRRRSVVVVTTSDQTPIMKVKGAISAVAHARYFAGRGKDVLLIMDSLTRFAMAQREIGLAAGEPPTLKGYTPSVFHMCARLVESCGKFVRGGSITGIFSVLVEGDDLHTDPVADALLGMLDGHIVLSRKRASSGLYPAVDPVRSLSRVMPHLVTEDHMRMALHIRDVLSVYDAMEEVVHVGLYRQGSNPFVDKVIKHRDEIRSFFHQPAEVKVSFQESVEALRELYRLLS